MVLRMNALIVINPYAGRQKFKNEIENIKKTFEEKGFNATVITTENKESVSELLTENGGEYDLVICAGGDGTLSETVSSVINTKTDISMGYIPAGTTNDFANSIGIPKKLEEAAGFITSRQPKPLDVGKFGEKYFIYVASFGAFTATSYNTTQDLKNSIGYLAYLVEGVKELPSIKSYHVKVKTDEAEFEDDYIFGAVSNSLSIGGIIKLNESQVDFADGKFELSLVKMPKNLIELSQILISLGNGDYNNDFITFVHTKKAEFTCDEAIPWSLDGEYAQGGTNVVIENLNGKLSMIY